ncbi:hypothetical protein SLEP1_g25209 [Rubroshorea leprosula]|uniref:Uncharacterized protein n=1 Tax=Rubroshorea leprosula TaxID=152421 RepID=A0AAV5JIE3_9ROSI|nr:hypothetical protein SLEP1_g25209 [Rubroshorea leprosula]
MLHLFSLFLILHLPLLIACYTHLPFAAQLHQIPLPASSSSSSQIQRVTSLFSNFSNK